MPEPKKISKAAEEQLLAPAPLFPGPEAVSAQQEQMAQALFHRPYAELTGEEMAYINDLIRAQQRAAALKAIVQKKAAFYGGFDTKADTVNLFGMEIGVDAIMHGHPHHEENFDDLDDMTIGDLHKEYEKTSDPHISRWIESFWEHTLGEEFPEPEFMQDYDGVVHVATRKVLNLTDVKKRDVNDAFKRFKQEVGAA